MTTRMDREMYQATLNVDLAVTLATARNCFHNIDEFYKKRESTTCLKCGEIVRVVNGQIVAFHNRENGNRCYIDLKRCVRSGQLTRDAAIEMGWNGK
jgi:hypothetical protein